MRKNDVVLIKKNSRESKTRNMEKMIKNVKRIIVFASSIRGRSKICGTCTFLMDVINNVHKFLSAFSL